MKTNKDKNSSFNRAMQCIIGIKERYPLFSVHAHFLCDIYIYKIDGTIIYISDKLQNTSLKTFKNIIKAIEECLKKKEE